MKKKLVVGLLALTILIGVAGTLSYARNTYLEAKEDAKTDVKEPELVAASTKFKEAVAPIISGQKDWDVTQGQQIDVLKGVTALDASKKKVIVKASSFSTEKVGDQTVTLSAKDDLQNETSIVITVHVRPVSEPVVEEVKVVEPQLEATLMSDNQTANDPLEATADSKAAPLAETPIEVQPIAQSEPTWAANTMYVGGLEIPYQNAGQGSGQGVIDSNSNVIATWGGNAVQSGSDGSNTHFIGHNPGIFNVLFSLVGGNQIIVTDGDATPSYYTVNQIFQVDDYATGVADGQSYVDQIIGNGGGERITLQTCVNDDINLIVMASAG